MPLPALFLDRLARIVAPADLQGVTASFDAPPATAFRRTLRAAAAGVSEADLLGALAAEGVEAAPVAGVPGAFAVPPEARAALLASAPAAAGHLYVQNPSSQVPVAVLGPRPGERVLDLCAAPGSKTGQIAFAMAEGERVRGEVVAVEKVPARHRQLRGNLAGQGALDGVRTVLGSGTRVPHAEPEAFDRVLVDAPCSTEGRFRTDDPATTAYWSARKVREMRAAQGKLLYAGVQALRPGGVLVYATCTFAPEENEGTLAKALRTFGDRVELVDAGLDDALAPVARPALDAWDGRPFAADVSAARRVIPDGRFEAFFVARLVKHASTAR